MKIDDKRRPSRTREKIVLEFTHEKLITGSVSTNPLPQVSKKTRKARNKKQNRQQKTNKHAKQQEAASTNQTETKTKPRTSRKEKQRKETQSKQQARRESRSSGVGGGPEKKELQDIACVRMQCSIYIRKNKKYKQHTRKVESYRFVIKCSVNVYMNKHTPARYTHHYHAQIK